MPQPQVFWQTEDPSYLIGSDGDICFQTQSNSEIKVYKKITRRWSPLGTLPGTPQNTILTAVLTLNDAEIQAFPDFTYVLVPSTETMSGQIEFPSEVFIPVSAYVAVNTTAGSYVVNSGTSGTIRLGWANPLSSVLGTTLTGEISDMLNGTYAGSFQDKSMLPFDISGIGVQSASDGLTDNSLSVQLNNVGSITSGSPLNTLTIVAQYYVGSVP